MGKAAEIMASLSSGDVSRHSSRHYGTVTAIDTAHDKVTVLLDGATEPTVCDARDVKVYDNDRVEVEVRDHKATIKANAKHQVTDDGVALDALEQAAIARGAAEDAVDDAAAAQRAATAAAASAASAEGSASAAATAATNAQTSAGSAATAASEAQTSAGNAATAATNAQTSAGQAQSSASEAAAAAQQARTDAAAASQAAQAAQGDAATAKLAADRSLVQLSIVENVSGTLNWIAEHGTYEATTDTTVQDGKVYFELVSGDYVPIAQPTGNPQQQGWYVLDITDSQTEYIMAHLAVTSQGLWVLPSGIGSETTPDTDEAQADSDARQGDGYKVLLSSTGMTVYDNYGDAVATYGERTTFASDRDWYVGSSNAFIFFDASQNTIQIGGANVTIGGLTPGQLAGSQIWTATADPTTPNYTFAISNLTGPSGVSPRVGDLVMRGYYRYTISSVGSTTVLTGNRTSIRGGTGAAGSSVTVSSKSVMYQASTSGTTPPTGTWLDSVPTVAQGSYLWTRTVVTYSTGDSTTAYSVARMGSDGQTGAAGPEAVVSISVTAVDFSAGTATLSASLRVNGTVTTPTSYKWTKGTATTSLGTSQTLSITDLNATYNCTVTWSGGTQVGSIDLAATSAVKTYAAATFATQGTVSTMQSEIEANAGAIALRATKTEAYQLSQPNLSPFFSINRTDGTYWRTVGQTVTDPDTRSSISWSNSEGLHAYSDLEGEWAHFTLDARSSAGNTGGNNYFNLFVKLGKLNVEEGKTYTWLMEVRNANITGGTLRVRPSVGNATLDKLSDVGTSKTFSGDGAAYAVVTAKTDFSSVTQDSRGYLYVASGVYAEFDLRLSLYEGEYAGPWKPYSGTMLYASQAELKVANDAIDARVEKNGVIAAINVSPETGVTIDASRVNINGAAIFTSGRLSESSLNNAYDAKGAASAVQTNLNNLQVGGRNLLRKTGSLTTSDLNLARATVTDGLIALTPTTSAAYASFRVHYLDFAEYGSGIYAVSFDAKLSGATSDYTTSNVLAYLGFQDPTKVDSAVLNSTYDRYTPARTLSSALTSDWKRYQTVVNVPDDLTTGTAAALSNGYMMVVEVGASAKKMPILIRRVKLERGNRATDWSPAPEDMASATQRVYYRTSTAASVAAPTTWVTANGNVWSQWTTKVPRLTQNADGSGTKYPYLYTCEQHRMGDGSIVCTAVLLDENTTVIDGGNIITNSITANKLQANSLTLGYINQNDAATAAALLNSNVVVGGKNLLPDSKPSAENLPKVSTANATNTFVTEDGFACYKGTGAGTSIAFYASNGKFTVALEANTQYTYSAWIKVTTTTSTTSLPFSFLSLGHFTVRNDNSTASDKTHEDVATERIYSPSTVTVGQWTKIVLTFTTNALSGSYFGVYSKYNYGTDYTLFIRDMKLEKGNKATDWTPSPEDQTTYVDTSLAESVESITATIDTEVDTLTGSITGVSNSLATLGTKVDNLLTKATELEKKTQWVKWDDTEGMIFGENGTAFNTRLKAENMTFNYGNQTMMTLSATGGVDAPKVRTQRLELGSDWAITISGDMFAIDYIGS